MKNSYYNSKKSSLRLANHSHYMRHTHNLLYFLLAFGLTLSCKPSNAVIEKTQMVSSDITKTSLKEKTIMAVFAHPDDELYIAPLMSKYAREGAIVQLVTVTDGRYGTGQTNLSPGDELTALRNIELNCAAEKIGIAPPIWMGYHDQLKLKEGFFGHVPYIQEIMKKMDSLVSEINPDVIITWGPDGGSNHMDHRIVGASITQVFLSKNRDKPTSLFYVGTPTSHIDNQETKLLRGVDDTYLTTIVSYSEEDLENSINAMYCYKTQFSIENMKKREEHWREGDRKVFLRPLLKAPSVSQDLFLER